MAVKRERACNLRPHNRAPAVQARIYFEEQIHIRGLYAKDHPILVVRRQSRRGRKFYTSVFKNSKILNISRYGDAGPGPKGSVMSVTFELNGQEFMALNGGPLFKFSEAISFFVHCETQQEVDELWEKLSAGGENKDAAGSKTSTVYHGRSFLRSWASY